MLLRKLNNNFLSFLKKSLVSLQRNKRLILVFLAIYFLSFGGGYLEGHFNPSLALEAKNLVGQDLANNKFFVEITTAIKEKNFLKAVFLTFLFNFFWGAFLTTTLVGLIFFLPFLVSFLRGFFIGLAFSGNLFLSPYYFILFLGTMIFEFFAYTLSSSYGTLLGLSFIFPHKIGEKERKKAIFKIAKEFPYFYFWVVVLLFLGAIWEIFGIIRLMEVF